MRAVLNDKAKPPTDARLTRVLGRTKRHWDAIAEYLSERCEGVATEWKFYGPKYGWTFKAMRKKRAVIYLTPSEGRFMAALALKGGALDAVRSSSLPPELIKEIVEGRAYPEGVPARIEVTSLKKVGFVKKLIAIKLAG